MGMQAKFYLAVNNLKVDQSAFGTNGPVEIDGRAVTLEIPMYRDDFWDSDDRESILIAVSRQNGSEDVRRTAVQVVAVCVGVSLHIDVLASEAELDRRSEGTPLHRAISEDVGAAWETARTFLARFLGWVSVDLLQSQHAIAARVPSSTAAAAKVFDRNGERVYAHMNIMSGYERPPWQQGGFLTRAVADRIFSRVRAGVEPPTPRQLLADAEFHAFHADDRNHGIAVVLAAVACERAVKSKLQKLAFRDQTGRVDRWLSSKPQSVAVADLFHIGLKAVAEPSVHEQNPALFTAIKQLFTHRNDFAHGRDLKVADDEIRYDLSAARRALKHLDAIEAVGE